MTSHVDALCFDANDPRRMARFWAGVLGWEMADDPLDGIALLPSDDTGFRIRLLPTPEKKTGPNQMHLDLTSTSREDQQQTVARSLKLGARHIDIGQRPDESHVVLADPEGNEFCVIEPGNDFLAGCGPPVAPRTARNRLRFDLAAPADGHHQVEVDRLVSLGATQIDGQPRPAG